MKRFLLVLFVAACSANSGPETGGTAGPIGGTTVSTCSMTDSCEGCQGCVARCTCMTGDPYECPKACGEEPPNPNDPPPGGGGFAGGSGSGGFGGGFGGGGSGGGGFGGGGSGGGFGGGGSGGTSGGPSGGSGGGEPPPPPGGGGSTGNPCTYPSGPYGTTMGNIVSPTLSWQGYLEDQSNASTISIQDYLDCDGSKGINAILLIQSAVWCGACQDEAQQLNGLMAGGWKAKGIRVLTLMIETASGNPATLATAKSWKDSFNATGWAVAADPDFTFASSGSNGLPTQVIVDPRSMKIVKKQEGAGSYSALENLAKTNATK